VIGRLRPLLGLSLAAAVAFPVALAQAAHASPPIALDVSVVGTPDDLRIVRDLLEQRLPPAGRTTWSRSDTLALEEVLRPQAPGVVRCWIDLRDRRRARLAFAAWSGARFMVRDVELPGGLDALDRAALAEVLDSSLEALVENERAGLSRSEAEALLARQASGPPGPPGPPAAPVPPVRAKSPLLDAPAPVREATHFEVGVFYAVQALTAGWPLAHGPGLALALATELDRPLGQRRWFAAAWLTAQYRLPVTASGPEAGVTLEGPSARAGFELGARRLRARLGAGLDLVHASPVVVDPAVVAAAARWSTSFVLAAALRAELYRVRGLRVHASLLVDLVPTAVDYAVDANGTLAPAFSPWRVRPGLALELAFR
jgi:hypothetical protein